MGCAPSRENLQMRGSMSRLSPDERRAMLVTGSWDHIKSKVTLEELRNAFENRLLADSASDVKPLFSDAQEAAGRSKRIMEIFDAAFGMLDSSTEQLSSILRELGESQGRYGVEDHHYHPFVAAMSATVEHMMGDQMTPETREAWGWAFNIVEESLKRGAHTERGQAILQEYKEQHTLPAEKQQDACEDA